MPKLVSVLLVFLGAFASARAESNSQWIKIQTEHFTVITDSSEKQGRHIAGQFERMQAFFHKLLPAAAADAGSPIIVFAFKDSKEFKSVEPAAYLAKGSLELAGLFLSMPDKNYILVRLDAEMEHPYAIVYHEYTHFMLRKSEAWIPLWLNEGLAEFYQNTDIEGNEVRLGQPSPDDILYLRDHQLLPLTTLLTVDHSSPYYHDEQKGSVFYAESWALTHFIEHDDFDKKTHRLQDYANLLQQHQDPVTAAQHAFGDLGQLQKALNNYIGQQAFKLFVAKFAFTVDEASFKAMPISVADVNAIRADILVGDDRPAEASALLDKVMAENPNNALARESEGFLCMRKQDMDCARKWFTEAVKLDSQSYIANYYFAVMSLQSGVTGNDDAIEASLRASIKAEPKFAPSYDTLANFYTMHNEKFDEAHLLMIQAIQLEPGEIRYRLNASNIEMRRNDFANATRILEAALPLAKRPSDAAMVQSRLSQLKLMQDQGGRFESSEPAPAAKSVSAVTSTASAALTADGKTFTVTAEAPDTVEKTYPAADASAKHHTIAGTVHDVKCSYPTVLTLKLDKGTQAVSLFSSNYYKVPFSTANYTSSADFNPCEGMEGMKASIEYADVTDPDVAGQIVSIVLSK